jgi:hypothetical protein
VWMIVEPRAMIVEPRAMISLERSTYGPSELVFVSMLVSMFVPIFVSSLSLCRVFDPCVMIQL